MKKEERFEEYKNWCLKYKGLPSQYSKDSIEKSLGKWRIKNKDWEKLIKFNSQFEIRKTPISREQRFKEEYIPFCEREGRLPSHGSKDPIEKNLGIWKFHNKTWEELIEFNSQFESKRKSRKERFEEYKNWCLKYKRLPIRTSKDPIEKFLGEWRTKNRDWEKLIQFNSQFEVKCKSREQRFKEEYIPWCLENNELPSMYSKDHIEKSLGIWRFNNRTWNELKTFNAFIEGLRKKDSMAISILELI